MDKFNVIIPTDNLEELDKDMLDWSTLPFSLRRRSDEECIRLYGCTNIKLYSDIKEKILSYKDLASQNPESNIVKEYSETQQLTDDMLVADKLELSRNLQQSPFIVLIEPTISTIEELNNKLDKFNSLSEKDRRVSNHYSMILWNYNVYNMYKIVLSSINSTKSSIHDCISDDNIMVEESDFELANSHIIEEYSSALYNNNLIRATILEDNIRAVINEDDTRLAGTFGYLYNRMLIESNTAKNFDYHILPQVSPWLTPLEMNKNGFTFQIKEGKSYYASIVESSNDDYTNLGWTKFWSPKKERFEEARLRQAAYISEYSPVIVDTSEVLGEDIESQYPSTGMEPIFLVFGYSDDNCINGEPIRSKFDKVGILINDTIYTFQGCDSSFTGFSTKYDYADYNHFELYTIFVDADIECILTDIVRSLSNTDQDDINSITGTGSVYEVLGNIRNDLSNDGIRLYILQYLELLCNIAKNFRYRDNFNNENLLNAKVLSNSYIYRLYSGKQDNCNPDMINDKIDIILNDTNRERYIEKISEKYSINDTTKDKLYSILTPKPCIKID